MENMLPPAPGTPPGSPELDPIRTEMFLQKARDEQNLSLAIAAGSLTGLAGAAGWAFITARTSTHYSLIAIGIGFAVGWVIQKVGRGIDLSFGISAAVIALVSVGLGDLLANCAQFAEYYNRGFFEVLWDLNWEMTVDMMKAGFSYIDLLFYAAAGYFAFRNARRQFSNEELEALQRP